MSTYTNPQTSIPDEEDAGMTTTIPTNRYEAADWITDRHPWAAQIAARVAGPLSNDDWLDRLSAAFDDLEEGNRAWSEYARRTREPGADASDQEYERWQTAGPKLTPGAKVLGVMSSGEINLARLLATLGGRTAWTITDVSFDARGAAILVDWLEIVRAQLPERLYPSGDPS